VASDLNWIDAQLLGYHEAAHAVVAVELGLDVYWTTIEPTTERIGGTFAPLETSTIASLPETVDFRRAVERDCLFLLAGWATERVIMPGRRTLEHFGFDDYERASDVLGLLPLSKSAYRDSFEYLNNQTMRFVARPEVFIRIRHVTDALLKKRTLSCGEVLRAIAAADIQHGTAGRRPLLVARPIVRPGSPILQPTNWRSGLGISAVQPLRVPVPLPDIRLQNVPILAPAAEPRPPRNERERRQHFANAFSPLQLSTLALGALRRGGIKSLNDLLAWTETELLGIRGVGKGIVREIAAAVRGAGYTLWPDDKEYSKEREEA
jgi:hypothetical protein